DGCAAYIVDHLRAVAELRPHCQSVLALFEGQLSECAWRAALRVQADCIGPEVCEAVAHRVSVCRLSVRTNVFKLNSSSREFALCNQVMNQLKQRASSHAQALATVDFSGVGSNSSDGGLAVGV